MAQSRFRNTFCVPLIFVAVCFVVPVHFALAEDDIDACNGTVWDEDGNAYGTVKVGDQCWMDKNMNVGTMIAGVSEQTNNNKTEKYCWEDTEGICKTDGGLYQWDEAMQYSTEEGARGICPIGWHIPTDGELFALEDSLKSAGQTCDANRNGGWDCSAAGTKLKQGGTSGLNIPLAGSRVTAGSFSNRSMYVLLWSSRQSDRDTSWTRYFRLPEAGVSRNTYSKARGFSVRCLKDNRDSLSIEIPKKPTDHISTATPILFTLKTTLPKTVEGTKLKNRMHIRMTTALVTMRYDRTEEDGTTFWKGTYNRPNGIVGPYHIAGTLEMADCQNDVGNRLTFNINDPTPGVHTVSAVVKNDEPLTKTTFVPADPVSPVSSTEEPSFLSKPITYLLKHLFGVSKEETEETENAIPTETSAEPVYAPLKEPDLTVDEARKLCRKMPEIFGCGTGSVIDADGNAYGVVQVGTQCWMDKNMNVGTRIASTINQTDNNIIEKYCYNNEEGFCTTDGGLYQWDEAVQYVRTEGVRGICPAGWHIPTDAEWHTLENYLTDSHQNCNASRNGTYGDECFPAGTKMKVYGSSGLNIPLAGSSISGSFAGQNQRADLWSSLVHFPAHSIFRRLLSDSQPNSGEVVYRYETFNSNAFSVRCIRD